ncbi:hypothetical protein [Enterovibrio coralii]|uniref:Uncharacterized protein n=1 Tax=Enterovibrio coralii TaxID=294935 RepID=A0A135IC98_9GAMM|nr:hypothetical protein [Enterovibrio coralii]KXF83008.1 hypothetical protein ATN88_04500 [Enterovibrio coralii]
MVDVVSTTAGSPTCNCSNPNCCIHAVKVTPKGSTHTYEYKQNGALPNIYVHDKDGKGVDVNVELASKGCVTGSSGCPSGVLFSERNEDYIGELSSGGNTENLVFVDDLKRKAENYNVVDFVSFIVLGKMDSAPSTPYDLMIGECAGAPIVPKTFETEGGKQVSVEVGPIMATESTIYVLPKYEYELGLTVAASMDAEGLTDNDRRRIMRGAQIEAGHNPDHKHTAHKGWTKKVPGNAIRGALSMTGSAKLSIANSSKSFTTDIIKKEFTQYKQNLSLLEKAEKALTQVNKMFAHSDSGKVKLVSIDFDYPKLEFKGSGKLKLSDKTGSPYIERAISVGLNPLVGVRMKIDLIQAFAAAYGAERAVAKIREAAKAMEDDFNEGKDAAYVGAELYFTVGGVMKVGFELKSNEAKEYEFQVGSAVRGEVDVGVITNIRGGVRYWVIEGYFEADARIEAKALFELESTHNGGLDLVFFHNGVIAKVRVDASLGIASRRPKRARPANVGRFSRTDGGIVSGEATKTTGTSGRYKDTNSLYNNDWVIYKKLAKEKSKCRITIM